MFSDFAIRIIISPDLLDFAFALAVTVVASIAELGRVVVFL